MGMDFETGLDSDDGGTKLKPTDYSDSKGSGHSGRFLVRFYSHSYNMWSLQKAS